MAKVKVWDISIRIFHWMLAATVSAAALTGFILGRTTLAWHLVAGVAAMIAVAWRVVWGLLGPGYARFASFCYPPATVFSHLRDLRRGRHHRYLGHNPLGAMMVFALLAVVAAIGLTGTIALGGMLKQGPLRAFLSYAAGTAALDIHNLLAILLLAMIAGHIAGVAFESWRSHENLVAAMVTGDKPARPAGEAAPPARAHPRQALAIMAAVLAASTAAIGTLAALPGRGVPPATPDLVFAEQCGSCHLAFPPSLAPASTWRGILAGIHTHFGMDAGLTPEQVAPISVWLAANAAERWDTLPSHLLRLPAADGSLRITDTPGWRRLHSEIAPATFSADPVYRRSNCTACHADADTGRFAPQAIAIPAASR